MVVVMPDRCSSPAAPRPQARQRDGELGVNRNVRAKGEDVVAVGLDRVEDAGV
jgi:hypothetical protein